MVYILDTNILRKMLSHLPRRGKLFGEIWARIERGISEETFISVDECFNELSGQFSKENESMMWLSERKNMFKNPDSAESLIIRDLFMDAKMRESIHIKNLLDNRPSADVYIAAKAKVLQATVVTAEEYRPHSAQLPNICEKLGVKCISYDDFMAFVAE